MQIELSEEELNKMVEEAVERRVNRLVNNLSIQTLAERQVQIWVWDKLKEMNIEELAEQKLSKDLLKGVQEHICGEIAAAVADKFCIDDEPWDEEY